MSVSPSVQAALLSGSQRDPEKRDKMVEALANNAPATTLVGMALNLLYHEGGEIEKRMAARIKAMIDQTMNEAGYRKHQLEQAQRPKVAGKKIILPGS